MVRLQKIKRGVAVLVALCILTACAEGTPSGRDSGDERTQETTVVTEPQTAGTAERTLPTTAATAISDDPTAEPIETQPPETHEPSNAIWREVPIPEGRVFATKTGRFFQLRDEVTGYDRDYGHQFNVFVFRGTVLSLRDFEITWTDIYNRERGPIIKGNVEVEINQGYSGASPVDNDIIRLALSFSVSWEISGQPDLIVGNEYVFVTKVFDEAYDDFIERVSPDFRIDAEKYADVFLSGFHSIFVVENEHVIINRRFFEHDNRVMQMALSPDSVRSVGFNENSLTSIVSLEQGGDIALSIADFDREFSQLVQNPENLPNSGEEVSR
jgi:hypothetical protein